VPNRHASTSEYRYSYQGSEKDDEIKGEGNSYTTHYRLLDPRVGRWLTRDPKSTAFESSYVSMRNNPILFNDVLGDTIRGVSKTSANRLVNEIKNSFSGNQIKKLFKLNSDGQTLSSIKKKDFIKAISSLSKDEQQLAYGYYSTINSKQTHFVEMANRNEAISSFGTNLFKFKTGADVDVGAGGGINTGNKDATYSIIVMDSNVKIGDFKFGNSYINRSSSPGELLAHEVLGHGVGRVLGSPDFHYSDAIQMTNLYLRVQGINYTYRDGAMHSKDTTVDSPVLSKVSATWVPSYILLPKDIRQEVKIINDMKDVNEIKVDKTYVKPTSLTR